jgi:hypothetical protein
MGTFILRPGGVITRTQTVSLDALIQAQDLTLTASMDALVQAQDLTLLASLDAKVRELDLTIATSLDALVRVLDLTALTSLDGLVQEPNKLLTSSLDAIVQAVVTQTTSLDAKVLLQDILKTVGLDGLVQVEDLTASTSLDALVQLQDQSVATSLDAKVLVENLLQTTSLDAKVRELALTKVASLDALVVQQFTRVASLDAIVQALALTGVVSLDAIVTELNKVLTASLDAIVVQQVTQTTSLDALVQEELTKVVSLDAKVLLEDLTLTASLDALVQAQATKTVTLDAIVQEVGKTATAVLDALIRQENLTVTTALDAVVIVAAGQQTRTALLDAIVRAVGLTESSALDAIVIDTGLPTLKRTALDAVVVTGQAAQTRRIADAPEKFYFGEIGDGLMLYGEDHQELGQQIDFFAEPNAVAPQGVGGECLFRNVYITVSSRSQAVLYVTPKIDGRLYDQVKLNHDGDEPWTRRYEVSVTRDEGNYRTGIRGTWFTVELTGHDQEGSSWDVEIEEVEIDYDPVRETHGHRAFTAENLIPVVRSELEILYWGELGDGLWRYDTGGLGGCLELSADGLICKERSGLVFARDFQVGRDRLDPTEWLLHWGTYPLDDPVNGYIVFPDSTPGGIYFAGMSDQKTPWIQAEVWHKDAQGLLPRVTALVRGTDGTHTALHQDWIIVSTPNRLRLCGVDGWSYDCMIPTIGGLQGNWWIMHHYAEQAGATEHLFGSDNDTNWSLDWFSSANAGRSGKVGLGAWRRGNGDGETRVRKVRSYDDGTITVKNIPHNHQVRIIRDAGEFGSTTISHDNTSGSTVDIVSDAIGFPVPPNNAKRHGPLTRIEIWIISGAKQAEMTPAPRSSWDVDGVNWGDVYCYNCQKTGTLKWVVEPNAVAPQGVGGECLFRNVYLAVTRSNDRDISFMFTPILDDVELPQRTIDLGPVTSPTTEVIEIPLTIPFDPDGQTFEEYRTGMRGTWFTFRLEDAAWESQPGELIFESADLDYTVLRETQVAERPATPLATLQTASLDAEVVPITGPHIELTNQGGLVYEREFTGESDSGTVGTNWVEHRTPSWWDVFNGWLRARSNSAQRNRIAEYDALDMGEMFVEVYIDCPVDVAGVEFQEVILRFDGTTLATIDGYGFRLGDNGTLRIVKYVQDSGATLANSPGDPGRDTKVQLYVADGVQEGWANGQSVSAADTAHDAANARDLGFRADTSSGFTNSHRYKELRVFTKKTIVMTGLPAGFKAKVLDSGDTVIAEATESGGTATILCHRFDGALDFTTNYASLIVTNAADAEQYRYTAAHVEPGATFNYTP